MKWEFDFFEFQQLTLNRVMFQVFSVRCFHGIVGKIQTILLDSFNDFGFCKKKVTFF